MAAFIPDGYTISGFVNAIPDHGIEKLEVSYRPATGGEVNSWLRARSQGDGERWSQCNDRFLSDHIVTWSIRINGKPVEVTPENCSRLHHVLTNRLTDIISGYDKLDEVKEGDAVPEAEAKGN